ncbi:hypothetical protein SASPL_101344 [Salvia splendens]|uniref:Uncharacterized protein n=1 Tax=Salvia splendens TaxID=180675 RepID=A0A8X8YUM8_SALSN|nr:hypothetical protein SASPL_101344 [Salvia splendens]
MKTPYLPDGRFDLEAYDALVKMVVLPMGPSIIYNVPSRTGQDIPPPVVHTLGQSTNLAGIKECVGNDIVVWSGNDDECHDSRWDYSATGVISVTSNLVPRLMRELMFGGKNPSLNAKLIPLIQWLFREPNPIAVNTALAQLRPVFRLPYVPLPLAKRVEFVNIVNELGRENFVGEKDVRVLEDNDFILIGRKEARVADALDRIIKLSRTKENPHSIAEGPPHSRRRGTCQLMSTAKFFGEVDTSGVYFYNVENVTEPGVFKDSEQRAGEREEGYIRLCQAVCIGAVYEGFV